MSRPLAPLTSHERDERKRCEEIIEHGLVTFLEVGRALLMIRDKRLYRETHATFEDYLHERWSLTRNRAYRLIEAAEVVEMLPTGNTPANEAQARELASLRHNQVKLTEVWQCASTSGRPTADAIRQARQEPEQRPLSPQQKAARTRERNQESTRRQQAMRGVLGSFGIFDVNADYLDWCWDEAMEAANAGDFEAWDRVLGRHMQRVAHLRARLSEYRP
jgi:hypothetical protein